MGYLVLLPVASLEGDEGPHQQEERPEVDDNGFRREKREACSPVSLPPHRGQEESGGTVDRTRDGRERGRVGGGRGGGSKRTETAEEPMLMGRGRDGWIGVPEGTAAAVGRVRGARCVSWLTNFCCSFVHAVSFGSNLISRVGLQ